jgi:hypothetical protein
MRFASQLVTLRANFLASRTFADYPCNSWTNLSILSEEQRHGFDSLEGPRHLRPHFDSGSPFFRRARRAHQLQSAALGLPLAGQAAAVLSDL